MYIRFNPVCEFGIEKSAPKITVWHHEACQVMTVIARADFSNPILTQIMELFSCSPLNTAFSFSKQS